MTNKIAFIASEYSENEFSSGGIKLNYELVSELINRGYEVDVYAQKYLQISNTANNYFNFEKLAEKELKPYYEYIISEKAIYPSDITYIHDHSYKYRLPKMKGKFSKLLYKFFSRKSHNKRIKQDKIVQASLDKTAKIIVSSNILKNDIITNFKQNENKLFILPPAVRQDINARYTPKQNKVVFGLSAVGFERKGGYKVLQAISKLKKTNSNFIVKIIYPKAKSNLGIKFCMSILGISKFVEFLPYQKNTSEFYNSIDCLLMPSLVEPFGMVATEAMSHYKPVIATDCCGACDYIKNLDLVCTHENLHQYMKKIIDMNANDYETIAKKSFDIVKDMSWNNFCDEFIKILENNNNNVNDNTEEKFNIQQYKKYNKKILLTLLYTLCSILLINYIINPYNIFPQHIFKTSLLKPEAKIQERVTKITSLKFNNKQIPIVLFGSSRSDLSISPDYYQKLTNNYMENLAIGGLAFEELFQEIDIALKIHPEIKTIYIGADFHLFMPDIEKKDYRASITDNPKLLPEDFGIALLSFKTTTDSVWCIIKTLSGIKYRMFLSSGVKYINHSDSIPNDFADSWREFNSRYSGGDFDNAKLDKLVTYIKDLQGKDINVILYIYPSHVTEFYLIHKNNQWNNYEQWKKTLSEVAPVYDFQYPNEFTTDEIRQEMDTYFDASHGTYIIGNKIIEDLVRCPQKECQYARYATSENIDHINKQNTKDMETWIKNNPELVNKINQEVK